MQADQPQDSLWESYRVNSQEIISKQMDGKVIGNSLHGFTKGKVCFTQPSYLL